MYEEIFSSLRNELLPPVFQIATVLSVDDKQMLELQLLNKQGTESVLHS